MKKNINISTDLFPKNIGLFIFSNGFEERWKKVLMNIESSNVNDFILIDRFGSLSSELVNYEGIDKDSLYLVDVLNENQVEQWNDVYNNVVSRIQSLKDSKAVIDITCIPQLILYSIICQLHMLELNDKVLFAYTGASEYSIDSISSSDSSYNKISTVLGYPGISKPSCNEQHLILMVGFDFDLAKTLIRDLEPTSLSLGVGTSAYQGGFEDINTDYLNQIKSFASTQISMDKISTFEFSCSDYKDAKESISQEIEVHNNKNVVLCSMNTKVSSIAAAMASLENETVKVCHIEPMFRNISDYSKCSDVVSTFCL
ncbi:hypothetical protein [Vibrio vulnificus]|uniref:Uncharacterized protein n=1 Tax=Vibrio vulnificus TaxID=672 RepID=A0AAW4HF38_VIBVL|nr:hypothetical protein [Vibrio vulnificus]ELV8766804.1 hypothetical protein [Vibrio vulnificus]MBN8123460.1 hypothetical protein [Vibrio vulnificus]HDY8145227.1 hypothetical protein [Vibrio vulnificus]